MTDAMTDRVSHPSYPSFSRRKNTKNILLRKNDNSRFLDRLFREYSLLKAVRLRGKSSDPGLSDSCRRLSRVERGEPAPDRGISPRNTMRRDEYIRSVRREQSNLGLRAQFERMFDAAPLNNSRPSRVRGSRVESDPLPDQMIRFADRSRLRRSEDREELSPRSRCKCRCSCLNDTVIAVCCQVWSR
jgi:hypothetical protein